MSKILLVEDDIDLGNLLKQYLETQDFEVFKVENGAEAKAIIEEVYFDLIILDVMMPNEDGFEVARWLSDKSYKTPFLFVTARALKDDVLKGFKLGADDYITKPFDADVLVFRIKNILKRNGIEVSKDPVFILGKYTLDISNMLLKIGESERVLTLKEVLLIEYLYNNKGKLIRKEDILNYIWKEADFFSGRSLDVFISRLRKYLGEDERVKIESVRGVGYRFLIEY